MNEELPGQGASNGWAQWSRHVLSELKRQNDWLSGIQEELVQARLEIARLQVKSGIWGAVGGILALLGVSVIGLLKGR